MTRRIRSFVRRAGRLTDAQARARKILWPNYGIDWIPGQALVPQDLFGDDHPVYLEIGFGNGETLVTLAAGHPERNFIGIEVHPPGVGHLLIELARRGLTNVRVIQQDAAELIDHGLVASSLAGAYLFFPDPWPKKRHHKRRLFDAHLLPSLARVLRPGGIFHAATDWEPYALEMLELLGRSNELFANMAGAGHFARGRGGRPITKFERRGIALGHRVFDLIAVRR